MSKVRLLVVEDDARLRKYIKLILTQADYDALEAQDGEQAMGAIRAGENPLKVNAIQWVAQGLLNGEIKMARSTRRDQTSKYSRRKESI